MPLNKEAATPRPRNHQASTRFNWLPDEIFMLPYFHQELINSDAAHSYIKKNCRQHGSFLLRTSSKGENHLTLSVSVDDGQIHHIQVYVSKQNFNYRYHIVPDIVFQSFSALQQHYSKHRIGNLEQVENVKLIHPLTRRNRTQSLPIIENPENGSSSRRAVELSRRTSDISSSQRPGTNLSNHHGSTTSLTDPRHRPPQPLPPCPAAGGSTPYYTRPTDEEIDRASELAELLRNNERCDCGLLLHEAELGSDWTVHKSRDASTIGKIFYQNVSGDTCWNLPESVLMKLSPEKVMPGSKFQKTKLALPVELATDLRGREITAIYQLSDLNLHLQNSSSF
ncbi:hypothetical protein LOTGIDRAFT_228833 [Lottia gigantea]|uniref:SH2 domain-containing protein n=1 Tax=Lottia gigantea TaxID=225164 RepID=V4A408_LOTGI|nr:hypothetical protein LOTGIDRAFT_228833 [Lottia gigantea]ESO91407.1 hypothetical protein LOTGIDRAFT_228833 [Lottia gigantea]